MFVICAFLAVWFFVTMLFQKMPYYEKDYRITIGGPIVVFVLMIAVILLIGLPNVVEGYVDGANGTEEGCLTCVEYREYARSTGTCVHLDIQMYSKGYTDGYEKEHGIQPDLISDSTLCNKITELENNVSALRT
jgi:hypothetical protein